MSFWSKFGKVLKKTGETALEVAPVVLHVNMLEARIRDIGRGVPVTPGAVEEMLRNIDGIRAGINDIRK